jgi:hypothetical protein
MARSSGLSKVPVLVHPVFIYWPNSPLKRCLNYFSDSFECVFSEVWPGGAQRSSRSTCRTDRAELYAPRSTFRGVFLHSARITIQGNPIEGGNKWARFCGSVAPPLLLPGSFDLLNPIFDGS